MKQIKIRPQFKFTDMTSAWDYNWDGGFISVGESHIDLELVYVVSGCVQVTEDTRLYELTEGDMVIHAPMEFHSIKSARNTSPHVYIIALMVKGKIPENLTEGVFCLSQDERTEFEALFKRFYSFFHENNTDYLLGQECINALSSLFIRMSLNHKAEPKMMLSHTATEYNKIVMSMQDKVYDNCSLEEIAKLNNTSISNMKILFKKYCGLSPKVYYQRLRCTEAIKLMTEGKSSAETADKLNFSSPNYFNTFFKRITGTPPASFVRNTYVKK